MCFHRFLIGVGSGLGLCVVPPYLSEISPPAIKGSVGPFPSFVYRIWLKSYSLGVLNQLGIVLGIFLTQALGIVLAAPSLWRLIPLIASAVALAQIFLSFYAVDSPAWLSGKSRLPEAKAAATLLWGDQTLVPPARSTSTISSRIHTNSYHTSSAASQDRLHEEEGLLSHHDEETDTSTRLTTPSNKPPTFDQLMRPPLLRPLLIVSLGMIAQQISGPFVS